ncbi:BAF_collapsed_G0033450.mRNA.1.CDS.1 [Saccharomyces cerevisiae]|nr:CFA_G0029520.mRNA.1.CDS.1 [Saccharomyces cerevisiae]CAI5340574.1 BAF_HP2_G0032740.mRNA.1.CDS.1 [Saccharomyces cerevisiae]CAI6596336.1 BAF_HP1_G0029730.mRNA.1.CDS.1 [Saccharomyces cerevisiae]CAI6829881.1 BAF_HP2_G0032740.mRNA.1.CDS.1 [Saccharomyces cerevisiae]CAI7209291.1 BAF_collapsed_G0033450.mRNA.1.CDS.1 [Saccharomyces cerevisiae]
MVSIRRYLRVPNELKPSQIFKQDSLSPSKIGLQIVLLQIFYYTTAIVLFYCWAKLAGYDLNIKEWLFSWENIDFTNAYGLSISLLWLLDSLICVFFLTAIVGRSKLAWDFAITIHAINFIVVFLYTRKFPSFSWFFLQILSSLILIFLGTWTTRWRELRDTFFEGLVDPNEGEVGLVTPSQQHSNHSELEQSPIQLKDLESQI